MTTTTSTINMTDPNIIRSNKRPLETPLISVGQYMWNELAKLKGDAISIVSYDKEFYFKKLNFN